MDVSDFIIVKIISKQLVFKHGVYSDVDELQIKINSCYEFFDKLTSAFSDIMSDKISLKVKDSDKDGFHYSTQKKRRVTKAEINKRGEITVQLEL